MSEYKDILSQLIEQERFDDYIALESQYYSNKIKPIENAGHYDRMFRAVENSGVSYGKAIRKMITINNETDRQKICYFLPSLDSDLAHIELLSAILKDSIHFNYTIYIAGFCKSKKSILSEQLKELQANGIIKIIPLNFCHVDILIFLQEFISLKISQLIITSVPILIMPFLEVLGASRVAWLSMKFELSCFTGLKTRLSFCSPNLSTHTANGVTWHRIPPKIVGHKANWNARKSFSESVKIVTINREEKIRNRLFLESVKLILENNPTVHFYWTGRNHDDQIERFFSISKISDRCHFLGWVNPKLVISEFDIFLDTPDLSGSVAAKVFTDGMPVATYKNSQSWIDFYKPFFDPELKQIGEPNGISSILFDDIQTYCNHVSKLINNKAYYEYISSLQIYLGTKYFSNSFEMSAAHFKTLDEILIKN